MEIKYSPQTWVQDYHLTGVKVLLDILGLGCTAKPFITVEGIWLWQCAGVSIPSAENHTDLFLPTGKFY